jgi:hypothetical protein
LKDILMWQLPKRAACTTLRRIGFKTMNSHMATEVTQHRAE